MANKDKFFWGASTASHQVEGGTYNQWAVWELENAKHQAKTAKKRLDWLPNWEDIKDQAEDPNNYISGFGVDHYNRYKEDFDILKELNLNAFRFTIEWSRVEPEEGEFDAEAIHHYKKYITELRARGIEPFLNLWHWTMPVWFTDMGGFEKRRNIKYFTRFVELVNKELLDGVSYVITLNEANSYVTFSYLQPKWPPKEKSVFKAIRVYYNLGLAHKRSYKILKNSKKHRKIGLAHQATLNLPANKKITSRIAASVSNYAWQGWFYNRAKRYQDFLGMNYYFTNYLNGVKLSNPDKPISDMGWYMEPYSISELMIKLYKKYQKPIFITENGVADSYDKNRKWWISETMRAIDDASKNGVNVAGYFHWSLLDNFEWEEGWWPKFGLVEVDRQNGMARKIRPSAKWWAEELVKRDQ